MSREKQKNACWHCRTSGTCAKCAQSRKPALRLKLFTILVHPRQMFLIKSLCHSPDTRNARKAQCLTSAAYSLCPHPNFFALLSPIPKLASAARSPATHNVNGHSACRLSKPLTLRHLTTAQTSPPEGLALPRPEDACVPIHNSQYAPTKPATFPEKNGISQKDAHYLL